MNDRSESIASPTSELCTMSPAAADVSTRSRTSTSIRSEPVGPSSAISSLRQVSLAEQAEADRVVDVVVDVGDPVDNAHDLPLERFRLLRPRVREDAVAHLVREVEATCDREGVLVVPEVTAEALVHGRVERLLAGVSERRVTHVVTEADRLDEILVQLERPRHDARDRRRLERVRHARAVVVALGVDEDLRLALQAAKRLRVDDAVTVALERRAHG